MLNWCVTGVKFLGQRVIDLVSLLVPASSFDEHAIDVTTIVRLLLNVGMRNVVKELKLKAEFVDGYDPLPRVVLECASQEGLWKEET